MAELKPCPFCGGEAGIACEFGFRRFHYYGACKVCRARGQSFPEDEGGKPAAASAWSTRTSGVTVHPDGWRAARLREIRNYIKQADIGGIKDEWLMALDALGVTSCRTEQDCNQPDACRATGGCERVEDVESAAEARVHDVAQRRELWEPGVGSVHMTVPELIAFGVECALPERARGVSEASHHTFSQHTPSGFGEGGKQDGGEKG